MVLNITTIISMVLGTCGNLLPLFFRGILVCSLLLIATFHFYEDYKERARIVASYLLKAAQ